MRKPFLPARFAANAPAGPLEMFQCHGRDCQRASGGAFSCVVVVPAESFKLTRGSLQYHLTQSAAGFQQKRGFCAECGSRISGGENAEGTSPIVGINAASLDDPSWYRPQHNIFTSDVAQQATGSTKGFLFVLAGRKALLEHDVILNLVPDRFPDGIGIH